MRHLRWVVLAGMFATGCQWFDHPGILVDDAKGPLIRAEAKGTLLPPDRPVGPAKLADPQAIARCLPLGVHLTYMIYPAADGVPFKVEQRLAEMGARCKAEGTLVDGFGKVIYVRPPDVPSGERPLQAVELPKMNQSEVRRFVEAILTPEQATSWRNRKRDLRVMWSVEKGEFDRIVLAPNDLTGTGFAPLPPPELERR